MAAADDSSKVEKAADPSVGTVGSSAAAVSYPQAARTGGGGKGRKRGRRGKSKKSGTSAAPAPSTAASGDGSGPSSGAGEDYGKELTGEDDGAGTRDEKAELFQAMFGSRGGADALKAAEDSYKALKAAGKDGTVSLDTIKAIVEAGKREGAGAAPGGAAAGGAGGGSSSGAGGIGGVTASKLAGLLGAATEGGAGEKKEHKFWSKQPVPQTEGDAKEGPLDAPKTVDDVPADPPKLPGGLLEWCVVDPNDDKQMDDLYNLLEMNYVEDSDAHFRFNYEKDFLRWVLQPPNRKEDWLVGVRSTKTGKLLGFIAGIPVEAIVHDKTMTMCEINFLCVSKKLRAKRLAPMLIKEVTRRVNRCDIWQAVYTAGVTLPRPVATCRYFHRSLQVRKLLDCKFTGLRRGQTVSRMERLHRLPKEPSIPGMRPLEAKDVPAVTKQLNEYLSKFKLRVHFTEEETLHWLSPRERVVDAFVVEDPETKEITGMTSFFHIANTVIGHPKHKEIRVAYQYYTVPGKHGIKAMMHDALILARNSGSDVFNALSLMENAEFFEELKFGGGDGSLNYYLYNWGCKGMESSDVGLILH